jgi:large subunit ribosomal protein L24e
MIRTYEDSFSGARIYPGKGKIYVRIDSKFFRFQCGKSESLFLQRKNPRRIAWTVLYRRAHKKGLKEETTKRRTRRTVKAQRAIVGATLEEIKDRRGMRPEARVAARAQAIKEGKEAKAKQKADKAKLAAQAGRGVKTSVASKQQAKGSKSKPLPTSR